MKREKVSALRSKRGLLPARQVAELQVEGLTPQTTKERKVNTVKTYLLKNAATVERKVTLKYLAAYLA